MEALAWVGAIIAALIVACCAATGSSRKIWPAVVVLVIAAGISRFPLTPSLQSRLDAERAAYLGAIEAGTRFGLQYEDRVDNRRLTYWMWLRSGLDNAIGVIYDPEDRLATSAGQVSERDQQAFERVTGGVIFRVERKGQGLYLVWHS